MSCNYDILEESKAGIYPLNGYLSLSYRGEVFRLVWVKAYRRLRFGRIERVKGHS